MKATAKELMTLGIWARFCEATGMDLWAVAEGKLPSDEVLTWDVDKKGE